jgi:hypothetical protein
MSGHYVHFETHIYSVQTEYRGLEKQSSLHYRWRKLKNQFQKFWYIEIWGVLINVTAFFFEKFVFRSSAWKQDFLE